MRQGEGGWEQLGGEGCGGRGGVEGSRYGSMAVCDYKSFGSNARSLTS